MTGTATAKPQVKQLNLPTAGNRRASISKVIIYVVLSLWALTTIYPFFWVIINSFKKKGLIRSDSFSIPTGNAFTMDNYKTAFERVDIFGAYRNSLIISVTVTIVVVLLAGFAAYGLSRYEFRSKKFVYSLIIASMMFPVFSTVIPVFRMMFSWKIANTGNVGLSLLSVILPQIAGNLSFAIIVLMGFIRSLPIDLEEAAFIEGCNIFQIFFRIIVPVAKPSFATVAIFTFLWSYNDLFTQMFFLRYKDSYTITLLLNEISSQAGVNYGLMAAAVVLVVVPVLIVYIFLQKNIIKGMTAGAIKG
ncbi:carbohydrate ABC transporter permease [Hydrogenoanaerobacterium sp.]|uniref:carbohydrate ABC transporter permease n=1 Tax=Hydrogenoanaerobacterium sp. TaxID=2953763 RepID=UPI00289631B7|nr:carbohydrate ABC transporter permease [Hydrogenoanaerobacterium sp.]